MALQKLGESTLSLLSSGGLNLIQSYEDIKESDESGNDEPTSGRSNYTLPENDTHSFSGTQSRDECDQKEDAKADGSVQYIDTFESVDDDRDQNEAEAINCITSNVALNVHETTSTKPRPSYQVSVNMM